jgi:S-adenosylmethionine:tRNA ribosyltransferase-isomerase
VGAGTFQPVKVDNIEDHNIHSEYLEVSPDVADMVIATKKAGKKVFSVGTTAARALETAFMDDNEKGYKGLHKSYLFTQDINLRQLID